MERPWWKKPEIWISGVGLAVLSGAFLFWLVGTKDVNKAGTVAAFAAAALFAAMCLRFVPGWMRFWRKDWEEPALEEQGRGAGLGKLFCLFLAAALGTLLAVFALRRLLGDTDSFREHLNFWGYLDTGYYLKIAQQGYTGGGEEIVFFPGYPLLVRLAYYLTRNYLHAALLVSALCYAASGCLLVRLLALDYGAAGARRAVKYLWIIPGAFFFAGPMSESLFLMLCLGSLYAARRGRWLPAAALGGYAAFTRSLGVLLLAPLILEAVHACVRDGKLSPAGRKKWVLRFASLLLVPLGTVLYLLINYRQFGDPFQFMVFEHAKWGQGFGLFWATAAYQTDLALYVLGTDYYQISLGLWLPNVAYCFIALILMTAAAKRLRPSYSAWFIAYYFFAIGTTYLISAPRYLAAAVPVYAGLAQVTENKRVDRLFSVLCVCAAVFYLWAFVNRWDVY